MKLSGTVGFVALSVAAFAGAGFCGQRPYEMEWANRTNDDQRALLALTDSDGWKVAATHAVATFEKSQDKLLFGDAVCKLTYRADGDSPTIVFSPAAPVPITNAFDTISCWVYGNNHSYAPDPKTPQVDIYANFTDSAGKPFGVHLTHEHFCEWFLCRRRLSPAQIERVKNGGAFVSFSITGGNNTEDRVLYFNSFAAFIDPLKPLAYRPRAKRGFTVFHEEPQGLNTGDGRLPFPNTPLTVIPKDPQPSVRRIGKSDSGRFYFECTGEDGVLEIRLPEKAGNWDTAAFRWNGSAWHPMALGGGIWFAGEKTFRAPDEKTAVTTDGRSVTYSGTLLDGTNVLSKIEMRVHLEGKSLAMDIQADGGHVSEVRFGSLAWLDNAQLIPMPYYTYNGYGGRMGRPCVLAATMGGNPFFIAQTMDWTQSNASRPFAGGMQFDGTIAANGGTRYIPKTDGNRNECFERFVWSFSPVFEDVLPNISNPVSPWKQVTGTRVWRAYGASDRKNDASYWRTVRRWGMSQIVVTDHETGWRDGNESFTFRTRPAPGKGGDDGQYQYARIMQDELGFVYGPYNNFTDFAPVNEFWSPDMVTRTPDSQLMEAWERCYAPKPSRAVEYCEKLAPIIQKKFKFSTAYCDVHTAVTPWDRCDYDARVPGAGTFAATWYAFGEIMLLQKAAWHGPVYSEGNNHFFYCGLTDGNYGQDQAYRISDNPWLVDFDLRRMHDLCCNFGMGNPEMFYPGHSEPKDPQAALDRFLTATIAFGHPGFLVSGLPNELQSYYLVQALSARYTQVSADTIRYADKDGKLFDISAAVDNGCYKRSQIITRYKDGTVTAANGNKDNDFLLEWDGRPIVLPPNGFCGATSNKDVRVFSGRLASGNRADLAAAPTYTYINGRGSLVRFAEGMTDGVLIRLRENATTEEVLFLNANTAGIPYSVASVLAMDKARKILGPAKTHMDSGYTCIEAVPGAFSYRVTESSVPSEAQPSDVPDSKVRLVTDKTEAVFPETYCNGITPQGQGDQPFDETTGACAGEQSRACGGDSRECLFLHPPYQGCTGSVFVQYRLQLPESPVTFTCEVGKADGSDMGDGIILQVWVIAKDGKRTLAASRHVAEHRWEPLAADLSPWKGQTVDLRLVAEPGANTAGDWSAWSRLNLVPAKP